MRVCLSLVLAAASVVARAPSAEQLAVVKDQFIGSLLTQDVPGLANFSPSALLHVNYSGVLVTKPGQRLQYNQTSQAPSFILQSNLTHSDRFAIFFFDAAQPGNGTIEYDHYGEYYLRVAKKVTGSGNSTNVVAPYVAPADLAPGTGPHRYVVVAVCKIPKDVAKPRRSCSRPIIRSIPTRRERPSLTLRQCVSLQDRAHV